MVFFLTNWVWRVFWYPFCAPYIDFKFLVFLISAVGADPPWATLIPEDQWFVMIKYRFYQKIENVKLCNFFLFEKTGFFLRKYRFSRYWYMEPVRKLKIRIRRQKLHIQCWNYPDSAKGRFWAYFLGPVPNYRRYYIILFKI